MSGKKRRFSDLRKIHAKQKSSGNVPNLLFPDDIPSLEKSFETSAEKWLEAYTHNIRATLQHPCPGMLYAARSQQSTIIAFVFQYLNVQAGHRDKLLTDGGYHDILCTLISLFAMCTTGFQETKEQTDLELLDNLHPSGCSHSN
jgi:hypothetical protein